MKNVAVSVMFDDYYRELHYEIISSSKFIGFAAKVQWPVTNSIPFATNNG